MTTMDMLSGMFVPDGLRPLKNATFCPIPALDSTFCTKWSFSSILGILNVCLWLKFSPALNLNKIEHFSKVSQLQFLRSASPRTLNQMSPNRLGRKLRRCIQSLKRNVILRTAIEVISTKSLKHIQYTVLDDLRHGELMHLKIVFERLF